MRGIASAYPRPGWLRTLPPAPRPSGAAARDNRRPPGIGVGQVLEHARTARRGEVVAGEEVERGGTKEARRGSASARPRPRRRPDEDAAAARPRPAKPARQSTAKDARCRGRRSRSSPVSRSCLEPRVLASTSTGRRLLLPATSTPRVRAFPTFSFRDSHEVVHDQVCELVPEERDSSAARAAEIALAADSHDVDLLGLEVRVAGEGIEELPDRWGRGKRPPPDARTFQRPSPECHATFPRGLHASPKSEWWS